MTSLYKRYIPPKAAAGPSISLSAQQSGPTPEPPKRKRERSEEEIAERKAKKLKKKGVPEENIPKIVARNVKPVEKDVKPKAAAIVKKVEPKQSAKEDVQPEAVEAVEAVSFPLLDVDAVEEKPATGEFSHVNSKKKRHKMEKEARKARKAREAARKAAAKGGDGEKKVEEEAGDLAENAVEADVAAETVGGDAVEVESEVIAAEPVHQEVAEVDANKKKKKKPKKEKIAVEKTVDEDVTMDSAQEEATEDEAVTREPKKAKTAVEGTHEAASAGIAYDEADSAPKKRRHKLEAALESSLVPDDDDSHLRKHGAVIAGFHKASRRAQALLSQPKDEIPEEVVPAQPTVQDLEMPDADLPPEAASADEEEAASSNLPGWLANPTTISTDSKTTFASLGLPPAILSHLSSLHFENALPVQQALLPLLLPPGSPGSAHRPGTESVLPDLAVSAATGSGKTLAYLLPMIEGLKLSAQRGHLTALVIVPTRELVKQVAIVAESLAKGSGLKIGTATGSGKFSDEQHRLVRKGFQYSPNGHDEAENEPLDLTLSSTTELLNCPPKHVVTNDSALDILIATPGRLLEHLEHTQGFNLVHLQFFVLDEADKLLDHQSSSEISALLEAIHRPRTLVEQDARERFLRSSGDWNEREERRVRKVLLSATMTRDVQRLGGLQLRFPRLISVQQEEEEGKRKTVGFEVPEGLQEFVVPVGDGSEKPLVALEWLRTRIFKEDNSAEDEDDSDSDSDSSSSESDTDSDDSASTSSSSTADNDNDDDVTPQVEKDFPPTVLIFTSTTESASRLTHLLTSLKSTWSPSLHTLTKSKQSLPRLSPTSPLVVISTDRAARGLDSLSHRAITHVLQYDVPGSLTAYVHRVGRTARNGKKGQAWTLYGRREAGWFLKVVGIEEGIAFGDEKAEGIRRKGLVERVKIRCEDERVRGEYERVLGEMKGEVLGGRRE